MRKYKISLCRVEYLSDTIEIEAHSEEEAIDKAWDQSGFWSKVEADEFINGVEEV